MLPISSDDYDFRVTLGTDIVRHDAQSPMSYVLTPPDGGGWVLVHVWGENARNVCGLWCKEKPR